MTARSLASVAMGLVGRRKQRGDADYPTDPVRAHSYDVDDARAKPHRPIGDGSTGQGWAFREALVATARTLRHKHREERYSGFYRMQHNYVAVLQAVLTHLTYRSGECTPAYTQIAAKAGVDRNTAIRAVEVLEHWGFLCHVRRSRKIEGVEGMAVPQRATAPNAYYFDCQARMPRELFHALWKALLANLRRVSGAARLHAARMKSTFNSNAQPAPRDPLSRSSRLGAALASPMADALALLENAIDRRDASRASASP